VQHMKTSIESSVIMGFQYTKHPPFQPGTSRLSEDPGVSDRNEVLMSSNKVNLSPPFM
jgi:hypothetical protein